MAKAERKWSNRHCRRSRQAAKQARQQSQTRVSKTGQQRRHSPNLTESSDDGEPAWSQSHQPQPSRGRGRSRTCGRLPHNQVERKYREGINSQLEALRQSLPSLQSFASSLTPERANEAGGASPPPARPSKATILATATAYIKQIEAEKQRLIEENRMLMYSVTSPPSLT